MMSSLHVRTAVVFWGLCLSSANAATISFQEGDLRLDGNLVGAGTAYNTQGTFVRRDEPDANRNSEGSGGSSSRIIAGSNNNNGPLRGMLSFDLSEIENQLSGGMLVIDSVSLVMRQYAYAGGNGLQLNLHQYDYNLTETQSTWNWPDKLTTIGTGDPNSVSSGTGLGPALGTLLTSVSGLGDPTTNTFVTFPDSAAFRQAVLDALSSPGQTLALMMRDNIEAVGAGQRFSTFRHDEFTGDIQHRPELLITFSETFPPVPEPSALLMHMGVMAFVLKLQRRRRGANKQGNQPEAA